MKMKYSKIGTVHDAYFPLGYGVLWRGEGQCCAALRSASGLEWQGAWRDHAEQAVGDAWAHATNAQPAHATH